VKGFHLCDTGCVASEWIDRNGHMNVTAYMTLFDKGTNTLLERCGIGVPNSDLTIVAARIMIDHRREFKEGERWELWCGIVSVFPTYLTLTYRLRSAKSIHAVCDIRGTPFSMKDRSSTYFPEKNLIKLSQHIIPGLVDRFITNVK